MVRSGPGLGSRVIGRFPAKSCGVSLAGRCEGEWCDMALGETRGWVNSKHIGVYELPRAATAGSSVPNAGSPPAPVEKPPAADRPQARAAASARQTEQGSSDDDDGSCVKRVDRDDTLRIRSGPGVDNDEIGEIPPRACGVAVSETCEGRWCRITYRGRRGWVNTYYID